MLGTRLNLKQFEISELENLTNGTNDSHPVRSFKLIPVDGENFKFKSGMFTSIYLHHDDKLFRSYSIASSPHEKHIELMIELIGGKFTSILENMKEGDSLYLTEPRGTFIFDPAQDSKDVFLAAGIGIAPFFSMLRNIRFLGVRRDTVLFYGVKHLTDVVNPEEINQYSSIGLKTVITTTRDSESNGWEGERGRITPALIKKHVTDFALRTYYLCGGLNFVRDLVSGISREGISASSIKRDIWGE